ncbi:MAG TPA: metal-dependent hydrolase [Chitinophagaceae bacterium]|nr:metal-dependent hydrolase [Chitinophagaceae bacterium]
MDTLTHIAIGACVGEVTLGKRLGRRASLTGAFANSVPDLDFIAVFFTDTDDNLLIHRGFTHSFLFAAIATVALAFVFERWFHRRTIHFRDWVLFFGLQILLHDFLDACNNYGTGWFEPFSHERISFHTIFVADPFFSIWLGIGLLGIIICKTHQQRRFWSMIGLSCCSIYMAYCVLNKVHIEKDVQAALAIENISYDRHFTTPAPLNNWLWFTVAGNDSGFYVGYRSVFDSKPKMSLRYFPRNDFLLDGIRDREDVRNLLRFSQGYYTIERWKDTLVFNDLRFGQMSGWEEDTSRRFAFHYFLNFPDKNALVVQRGRFSNWDRHAVSVLWRRIRGN